MNGCYLESQLKQLVMRPLFAFREYIFRDVLPTFSNLDGRADQMANEYFERMGSQPASEIAGHFNAHGNEC